MKYSFEEKARIIAEVLGLLVTGMSTTRAAKLAGVPVTTFLDWCDADEALAVRYARAYRTSADAMAEELMAIADEEPRLTQHGTIDSGDVANRRLRADARKWILSKQHPSKYGDRLQVAGDANSPLKIETTIDVAGLSVAALEELANLRKK